MITATEILDWAIQYKDIGQDGFKAEMLLLAQLSQSDEHPLVSDFTFTEDEWLAFASVLYPQHYQSDWVCTEEGDDYATLQKKAVCAFKRNVPFECDFTGDLNELSHKIIWASGFGVRKIDSAEAVQALQTLSNDNLSNDDKAKVYLSMVLLKQDAVEPQGILTQQLEAYNYHEILIMRAANHLKEK